MHPKHTLYAIAWGMLTLPPRAPQTFEQRLVIKRACRAYARLRGFRLELIGVYGSNDTEVWNLDRQVPINGAKYGWRTEFIGSLQECCFKLVEHDLNTEGFDAGWKEMDEA